jgi:glycosyltransferase involved in cell wall biosynthesis
MQLIDLAIIIPTLNEEHYIGKLLDSIASQTVSPKEIVVVDAESKDKTIDEIKLRQKELPQLKYYQIPKYTISRQRNYGVKKTTASHLLFLDADMLLKRANALELLWKEIEKNNCDFGVAKIWPLSKFWSDWVYFYTLKYLAITTQYFWFIVTTMNFYVTRKTFEEVGGFDEDIRVGEDMELAQRMLKKGAKFRYFNRVVMYVSVRRQEKEGRWRMGLKLLKSLYFVHKYGFKDNPIEYKFGHHGKTK